VTVSFIGGGNLRTRRTGYENKDISLNDIFFYQLVNYQEEDHLFWDNTTQLKTWGVAMFFNGWPLTIVEN